MEFASHKLICMFIVIMLVYNFYIVFQFLSDRRTMFRPTPEFQRSEIKEVPVPAQDFSRRQPRHIQHIPKSHKKVNQTASRDVLDAEPNGDSIHMEKDLEFHEPAKNSSFFKKKSTTAMHHSNSSISTLNFQTNIVEADPANFSFRNEELPTKCLIRYPSNKKLKISNVYWQVLKTLNGTFYLYNAFYDNRQHRKNPEIRILGVATPSSVENGTFFCQFWFTEFHKAKVTKATPRIVWAWKKDKQKCPSIEFTYAINCPLKGPIKKLIPFAVSVVRKKCDLATNKLKVIHNPPQQKPSLNFGVCVKGLDFPEPDISSRLIEWIELLKLLGADKIHTYLYAVHPNVQKVLEYYHFKGIVDLRPLTLPGTLTNDPIARHTYFRRNRNRKRCLEIMPYNDCFYHGMYRYKYIVLLDIDEVIVPIKYKTWNEVLDAARQDNITKHPSNPSSYQVKQTGCFFDGIKRQSLPGIPPQMHMLQHIYKIPPKEHQPFGVGTKAFFVPNRVLEVFNHFPFACFPNSCAKFHLNETEVQLQHYKDIHRHCNGPVKGSEFYDCDNIECLKNVMVMDNTISKYKDDLVNNYKKTISAVFKHVDQLHHDPVDGVIL